VAQIEQIFAQASVCHSAKLWAKAEELYQSILDQEPEHAAALHRLGLLAYQNGAHDRAISLIQKAILLRPEESAFHNGAAAALLAVGRKSEAAAAFERVVALEPGSAMARNNLAYVLNALGLSARARAEYEQALRIDPGAAAIRNNFAQVLASQGDFDLAIENFRTVLASTPSADAYANLANALCAKGLFNDAIAACESASRLNPQSAFSHYILGKALCGLERYADAVEAYKKAIAIAPDVSETHKNLAVALHHMKAWDAAQASFEAAARLAPHDRTLRGKAEAYAALSQMKSGLDAFYRVLETSPEFDVLYNIGDALNTAGFHSAGLETMSRGAGVTRMSLATTDAATMTAPQRVDLTSQSTPSFIGCWMMASPDLCDRLVTFFEANAALQKPGHSNSGLNRDVKRSTDIPIMLTDLAKPDHAPLREYLGELEASLQDYGRQWPHLAQMLPSAEMGPFNMQRYQKGEHFQACHNERMNFRHIHRVLAWMTYLNDVEAGGETAFPHFGLDIKPQRGKTVIWPAEWTHAHAGKPVIAGTKYIVTGWLHFPHPRDASVLSSIVR